MPSGRSDELRKIRLAAIRLALIHETKFPAIIFAINMPSYRRIVTPIAWTAGALCLLLLLQRNFAFNFYYAEQWRMFRLSGDYAAALFSQPGGAVEYVTTWLIQYFNVPYVGALTSTLVYLAGTLALRSLLRTLGGTEHSHPLLYLLPGFAYLWAFFNESFHFEAAVAFALTLALLAVYVRLRPWKLRITVVYTVSPLAWWLAGPMALLFPAVVLVAEGLCSRDGLRKRQWPFVPLILWAFIPALLWFYSGACSVPFSRLVSLSAYWHPLLPTPALVWIPPCWVIMATVFATGVHGRPAWGKPLVRQAICAAEIAAVCLVFWRGSNHYHNYKEYMAKQLDYYAATGQWDAILNLPGFNPAGNYLLTSYQNLALSESGRMEEHLFDVPQCDLRGLWPQWNRMAPVSAHMCRIAYAMGNVALAQALAFEGMAGSEHAVNPRLLTILAKTNLIFGQYRVAEKYIGLLEQTATYSKEARHLRGFLYHDRAIMADKELGALRRCTAKLDGLTNEDRAPLDLWPILQSNPRHNGVSAYYGASCLLMKDLRRFSQLLEIWRNRHPGQALPKAYQEAAVIIHGKEAPRTLQAMGISPTTLQRFQDYNSILLSGMQHTDPQAAEKLREAYGNTYWYYYTFTK